MQEFRKIFIEQNVWEKDDTKFVAVGNVIEWIERSLREVQGITNPPLFHVNGCAIHVIAPKDAPNKENMVALSFQIIIEALQKVHGFKKEDVMKKLS